jgi:DNA-binding transcriptional ArsR family regulator
MSAAAPESSTAGRGPSALFAALGDGARLHLVSRLSSEGPLSITRLSSDAGITRQAVTRHLHVLEDAGLVNGSRHGREQVWELRPSRLQDGQRYLDLVSREWDLALARLRAFVEEPESE